MRTFVLRRTEDVSGVSGVGDVAEGVVFSDGTTVLRWLRAGGSTAVYDSLDRMEAIHGHDSRTAVVFGASPPPPDLSDPLREAALLVLQSQLVASKKRPLALRLAPDELRAALATLATTGEPRDG